MVINYANCNQLSLKSYSRKISFTKRDSITLSTKKCVRHAYIMIILYYTVGSHDLGDLRPHLEICQVTINGILVFCRNISSNISHEQKICKYFFLNKACFLKSNETHTNKNLVCQCRGGKIVFPLSFSAAILVIKDKLTKENETEFYYHVYLMYGKK